MNNAIAMGNRKVFTRCAINIAEETDFALTCMRCPDNPSVRKALEYIQALADELP